MRILILADAGGPATYHVGDEAMLASNVSALRAAAPEAELVVASADPGWTAFHHGVDAVARRRPDEAATPDLAGLDGVLVSGGGNLSASWPALLRERTTHLLAAHRAGKPAVLVGQTIGPDLGDHRAELAEALDTAALVGIREGDSYRLAGELGVAEERAMLQHDDALLLDGAAPPDLRRLAEAMARPWIAVTVHPFADLAGDLRPYRDLAARLDEVVAVTGARLLFIPHVADGAATYPRGDARVGHLLARELRDPGAMSVVNVRWARETVWLTQQADAVLSTRYHPLVFGIAGGIPGLGVHVDEYTRIKLSGALATGGLERHVLPLADALEGSLAHAFGGIWESRETIAEALRARRAAWERDEHDRRVRMYEALTAPA